MCWKLLIGHADTANELAVMGPSQVTFRIAVSLDLFSISPILPNVFEFNETIIILEASTPFHSKPHNFQLISFTGIKSFYNDFVSSESFL